MALSRLRDNALPCVSKFVAVKAMLTPWESATALIPIAIREDACRRFGDLKIVHSRTRNKRTLYKTGLQTSSPSTSHCNKFFPGREEFVARTLVCRLDNRVEACAPARREAAPLGSRPCCLVGHLS